jgi:hypothetical protein
MAKVYVSSTVADLEAERRAVMDWLVAAGHQPVHSYRPDSETVRESCLDDIEDCDLYVLILGHRYGFQPEEGNPETLSERSRTRRTKTYAVTICCAGAESWRGSKGRAVCCQTRTGSTGSTVNLRNCRRTRHRGIYLTLERCPSDVAGQCCVVANVTERSRFLGYPRSQGAHDLPRRLKA